MELYAVVLEKLKVTNGKAATFSYLKYLKSDAIIMMGFFVDKEEKCWILVKMCKSDSYLINHDYYGNKNVSTPAFSINHKGVIYDVFEGEFMMDYCFQDCFDFDHMTLMLKSCAILHANFLLKSAKIQNADSVKYFYRSLQKYLQRAHTITFENENIDLNHLKLQYYKLLESIETTLNTDYLVPSIGNAYHNVVMFKNDSNGDPVDLRILASNSFIYVPPIFDVLLIIFTCTSNDTIKDFLEEFLLLYCGKLIKHFGNKLYDLYQIDFQIRSFIPFIKLMKCTNNCTKICVSNNNTILQQMSEYLHHPNLLREECYEVLQSYLEHRKYFLQEFSLTPLPQRSGNLGDYFKLHMNIQENTEIREVNLFVKFLPSNNETLNALVKTGPSMKEDFFYNYLLKEFRNCGLSNFLSFAPKCFMSKINHVLVLEDLGLQGYTLNTDQNDFNYNMLSLTIKKLAQLHACSIVYEELKSVECSKTFRLDEHHEDYFKEILFQTGEENDMKILTDVGERAITDYLIYLYPEICRDLSMEEFHRRSKLAFKIFYSKVLKSSSYRNTLCHGDTWSTNIMFKCDINNLPIDCKFVDFQLIRYCPPIQDVMSHIYLTTSRDIRTKYLTTLLEEYYEELSKIVNSFSLKMENILPAEEFQRSCRYMKSQAVCQALFYSPINLTNTEDRAGIFGDPERFEKIMKQDRSPFIEEMIAKYPFYKGRLGELVQDLYDICDNEQYL